MWVSAPAGGLSAWLYPQTTYNPAGELAAIMAKPGGAPSVHEIGRVELCLQHLQKPAKAVMRSAPVVERIMRHPVRVV